MNTKVVPVEDLIRWGTAFPVLATLLDKALHLGAGEKAREMGREISALLAAAPAVEPKAELPPEPAYFPIGPAPNHSAVLKVDYDALRQAALSLQARCDRLEGALRKIRK